MRRLACGADDGVWRIEFEQLGLVLVHVFLFVLFFELLFQLFVVVELFVGLLVIVGLVQLERLLELQQFRIVDAEPKHAARTAR